MLYYINWNALTSLHVHVHVHSVKSFTELAPQLLMIPDVHYLLSEVFLQYPLEHYFSHQRHCGGSNENPTAHQAPCNAATLVQQQWVYHELKSVNTQPTLYMYQNTLEITIIIIHVIAVSLFIVTGRKMIQKKIFISTQEMTCQKDRNKAGMRKIKNTTLLRLDSTLLFGPQCIALASLVHFEQSELGMQVDDKKRKMPSFRSSIVFLSFLVLCIVPYVLYVEP